MLALQSCPPRREDGYLSFSLPQPSGAALSWGRHPDKRRRSHTSLPARTAATGPGPDALSAAGWTSSSTAPWLTNPAGGIFNSAENPVVGEGLALLIWKVIKGLSSSKLFQVEGISTQILQLIKDKRWEDNPAAFTWMLRFQSSQKDVIQMQVSKMIKQGMIVWKLKNKKQKQEWIKTDIPFFQVSTLLLASHSRSALALRWNQGFSLVDLIQTFDGATLSLCNCGAP